MALRDTITTAATITGTCRVDSSPVTGVTMVLQVKQCWSLMLASRSGRREAAFAVDHRQRYSRRGLLPPGDVQNHFVCLVPFSPLFSPVRAQTKRATERPAAVSAKPLLAGSVFLATKTLPPAVGTGRER